MWLALSQEVQRAVGRTEMAEGREESTGVSCVIPVIVVEAATVSSVESWGTASVDVRGLFVACGVETVMLSSTES